MANPFDAFDSAQAPQGQAAANPFDRFDAAQGEGHPLPVAKQDEGTSQPSVAPSPSWLEQAGQHLASHARSFMQQKDAEANDTWKAIGDRIVDAWQNSPHVLTPKAQAWLDNTGMGGVTRLADLALAVPNAVFAGGIEAASQTAKGIAGKQAGKGVGELGEYLMQTPELAMAPHVPGEAPRSAPQAEVPVAPSPTPTLDAVAQPKPPEPPVAMHTPEQAAIAELDNIASGKPAQAPTPEPPTPGAPEPPPEPVPPSEGLKPVHNDKGQWIGFEREAEPPAPAPATANPFDAFDEKPAAEPKPAEPPPEVATAPAAEPEPPPPVPAEAAPEPPPEPPPEQPAEPAEAAPAPKRGQRADTPFETPTREPTRLIEWLRRPTKQFAGTAQETTTPGGIIDEGGDLKAILGSNKARPGLINKNGRTLDDAAHAAWEAGYLPGEERPDINALKDAIRDDHNGIPRYSEQDFDRVDAYRATIERNAEIDRLSAEHGIPTVNLTRDQFYDALHDKMSQDERAAEMASQDEAERAAYAEAEKAAKQWVAYHGTPHDFDEFDLAHIGKGEGAQAYGHGFYFAENPKVAGEYQRKLAPLGTQAAMSDLSGQGTAARLLDSGISKEDAIAELQRRAKAPHLADNPPEEAAAFRQKMQAAIDWLNKPNARGNLLQVRLHAKPEEMLDWDKPVSEQPTAVQQVIEESLGMDPDRFATAGDAIKAAEREVGDPIEISRALSEAGIKGIRYLDRGSRAGGEGTHNVVMFDPRDIEITHRNGKPVASEPWNAQHFYGQSQGRTLEDLEREHQSEMAATEAGERQESGEQPGPPGERQGPVPEGNAPPGRDAGAPGRDEAEAAGAPSKPEKLDTEEAWEQHQRWYQGRLDEAQRLADIGKPMRYSDPRYPHLSYLVSPEMHEGYGPGSWRVTTFSNGEPFGHMEAKTAFDAFKEATTHEWTPMGTHSAAPAQDLLGRPVTEPRARSAPEPTIRNDERQIGLLGTEASAVQAQAARDAGRGTLHGDVTQKPLNEGLFAPDTSGQGSLYSFPGMLFDPAAYKRALGPLWEALNKPQAGYELLRDKQGMRRAAAEIRAGLAPTSMRGAKPMEYAIRRHNAESAQAYDQSLHALEQVRAAVDKLPVEAQVDFTNRMETGQAQPTPELQAVATALRSQLDGWAKKIQGLGKGHLADAIENYMGHIWGNYAEWAARRDTERSQPEMQAAATAKNVRRQPIRGSGAFLKQRSFPTQLEGINAGLIPVTTNPVDLQLIKLHEMQKFYHGTVLADQIKQQGMATWVPATAEAEHDARLSGWVPLDDTIFKPRIMGQNNQAGFGRLDPGSYWAPEPLARVFNNYMSQGWHGKSAIYDGIRRGNNALNSLQLGFSGFHLAFVTSDTAISRAALGLQQITQGRPLIGAKNIAEGATILPSAVHTLYSGAKLRKAWLDPANATPAMQKMVEAMKAGGMRVSMPDFFRSSASGSFFRSINDLKNPMSPFHQAAQMFADAKGPVEKALGVPARIAMRAMDTIQQPLMGYLVPRMKLGVFSDMAKNWLDQNPNASPAELSAAMTKIQDSVDNRLGQLNYDNLFWNKVAKDLAFVTTRSVGWNLGTMREIGGGFVDAAAALRDIARGKWPKLTERMAYTIMLPIITAEIGSIMTYATTGQAPQHRGDDALGAIPLDYFYPPTGPADANGNVDRLSIPGYMKDVIAASNETYRNYEHGGIPIPKQTLLNKTAPLFETGQEILNNQDYYGGIIYDPNRDRGRLPAYGDYLLNQMAPFTLRSQNKLQDQGASSLDQALGWFGFQPAPKSITAPGRGENYQLRQEKHGYRQREKEPGRISVFNAP